MEDWQIRVIEEKKQLDERLEKLTIYLNSVRGKNIIDRIDYSLLLAQQEQMRVYSDTLDLRIKRFK